MNHKEKRLNDKQEVYCLKYQTHGINLFSIFFRLVLKVHRCSYVLSSAQTLSYKEQLSWRETLVVSSEFR